MPAVPLPEPAGRTATGGVGGMGGAGACLLARYSMVAQVANWGDDVDTSQ